VARRGATVDRARHRRPAEQETRGPVRDEAALDRAASTEGAQEEGCREAHCSGAVLCRYDRRRIDYEGPDPPTARPVERASKAARLNRSVDFGSSAPMAPSG